MVNVTFEVEGVNELLRSVEREAAAVQRRVQAVIVRYALRIEELAKRAAPVDTGFLRSSIHTVLGRLSAEVIAGASYAVFVELGTRFTRAQPFLFPALESVRADFYRELKAAIV
jgi:HK97 gp10 family phage protein